MHKFQRIYRRSRCTGLVIPLIINFSWCRCYLSLYFVLLECLLNEEGWYSVTSELVANQIGERCRWDTILNALWWKLDCFFKDLQMRWVEPCILYLIPLCTNLLFLQPYSFTSPTAFVSPYIPTLFSRQVHPVSRCMYSLFGLLFSSTSFSYILLVSFVALVVNLKISALLAFYLIACRRYVPVY